MGREHPGLHLLAQRCRRLQQPTMVPDQCVQAAIQSAGFLLEEAKNCKPGLVDVHTPLQKAKDRPPKQQQHQGLKPAATTSVCGFRCTLTKSGQVGSSGRPGGKHRMALHDEQVNTGKPAAADGNGLQASNIVHAGSSARLLLPHVPSAQPHLTTLGLMLHPSGQPDPQRQTAAAASLTEASLTVALLSPETAARAARRRHRKRVAAIVVEHWKALADHRFKVRTMHLG
jgi:hypothetical protein